LVGATEVLYTEASYRGASVRNWHIPDIDPTCADLMACIAAFQISRPRSLPSVIPQTAISVCDSRNQSFGGLATRLFQKRKLPPDTADQITIVVVAFERFVLRQLAVATGSPVAEASVKGATLRIVRNRLRHSHSSDRSASLASARPASRRMAWGRLGLGSGCFPIQRLIKANWRSGTRTCTLLPVREGGLVFFIPQVVPCGRLGLNGQG